MVSDIKSDIEKSLTAIAIGDERGTTQLFVVDKYRDTQTSRGEIAPNGETVGILASLHISHGPDVCTCWLVATGRV